MDRGRRYPRCLGREDSPPPPPPAAPAPPPMQMPQATAEQTQMLGMMREMFCLHAADSAAAFSSAAAVHAAIRSGS